MTKNIVAVAVEDLSVEEIEKIIADLRQEGQAHLQHAEQLLRFSKLTNAEKKIVLNQQKTRIIK